MENQNIVVLITTPSQEAAVRIARALLEEKIAACVNIIPSITSLYTWEEAIHEDAEALMLVKTRSDLFDDRLIPAVKAIHPYEVPEIISLPIASGLDSYLNWMNRVTQ